MSHTAPAGCTGSSPESTPETLSCNPPAVVCANNFLCWGDYREPDFSCVKHLVDCHLYAILDLSYVDISDCNRVAELLIDGGVDLIQLRGKKVNLEPLARVAADLHPITLRAGLPLIINDHPEVAASISLEGVHLGQEDLPIHEVRQ